MACLIRCWIVVTPDSCTVTTNQWRVVQKLNEAQRADIRETLSYQEAKGLRAPMCRRGAPKETTGPQSQLDSLFVVPPGKSCGRLE